MSLRSLALALLLPSSISLPTSAQVAEVPGSRLQHVLTVLAESAKPGVLGITAVDLRTGTRARVNADHAFPMMSVIKAPVAAAVLSRVDAGLIGLDQMVTIDRKDLVPGGGSAIHRGFIQGRAHALHSPALAVRHGQRE